MDFRHMLVVLVVLTGTGNRLAEGYMDGAPTRRCDSMTPGHGSDQGNGVGTYTITTSADHYIVGNNAADIEVTVSGNFQGLLLEARLADGSSTMAYGTFSGAPTGTKTINCGGTDTAVTHSDIGDKTSVVVQWTPPSTSVGHLQFVATILTNQQNYYKGVMSAEVKGPPGSDASPPPPHPTGTTPDDDDSQEGSDDDHDHDAHGSTTTTADPQGSNGANSLIGWTFAGVCLFVSILRLHL